MARTAYYAPGVYVEEVPSTQKPIAGVGTNTAAFIGIVPKEIKYPARNPDYDPVLAKLAHRIRKLVAARAEVAGEDEEKMEGGIDSLKQKLLELEESLPTAKEEHDIAKQNLDVADQELNEHRRIKTKDRTPEWNENLSRLERNKVTADGAFDEKKEKLGRINNDIERLKRSITDLEAAKKGQQTASKAEEPSILRPYVLKSFKVDVEPFDTKLCTNFSEYRALFGDFSAYKDDDKEKPMYPGHCALTHAVYGFFQNGGTRCFVARIDAPGELPAALENFESIDAVALVAAPGMSDDTTFSALVSHCETCEDRFAILDCPEQVGGANTPDLTLLNYNKVGNNLPKTNKNAAYYFPYIQVFDPAKSLQDQDPACEVSDRRQGKVYVAPSGHVAGIYARTDEERGVHKAPANAAVLGALDVKYYIGKPKHELLNPQGVNVIRNINGNIFVWGARTVGGDMNAEWKYVSVRRLFLYLRESIDEGTQWVVFEPNDMALWGKIRRNVGAFLTNVWRSGALFGSTPEEAFYVKCDAETNPPEVREVGQVVTEIGVAIVRPAEFVIFRIMQSGSLQRS